MIHFTFGYQAVFNIVILISNHVYVKLTISKPLLILISTCTSLKVIYVCTYLYSPAWPDVEPLLQSIPCVNDSPRRAACFSTSHTERYMSTRAIMFYLYHSLKVIAITVMQGRRNRGAGGGGGTCASPQIFNTQKVPFFRVKSALYTK